MKTRPKPDAGQLQRQAALQDLRKSANTMAHAVRLGKVPGVMEDERGACETPRCGLEGRRFTRSWWDADPNLKGCGFVRSDGKKRCVLCTSQQIGVIS